MAQRPGVAGAPITIHIRDPTGAEFTSVRDEAGVTTSLVNIPVNTSVYDTGPVWAADPPQYQAGTYEVWADCNANGMKDNYNQAGKTTTQSQPATGVQVGGTNGPSITVVGYDDRHRDRYGRGDRDGDGDRDSLPRPRPPSPRPLRPLPRPGRRW